MGLQRPAVAMIFLAPDASTDTFDRYLVARNQQSYTQWSRANALKGSTEAHDKVMAFAHSALDTGSAEATVRPLNERTLKEWETLRLGLDLRNEDREVLALLAEKLHQPTELCRYLLLDPGLETKLQSKESVLACNKVSVATPKNLAMLLSSGDLLSIDGVMFSADQIPVRLVAGTYRWKVLSNRFVDRSFAGTVNDFLATVSTSAPSAEPWVKGDCRTGRLEHPDFAVLSQAKIYFNDECVAPGIPPISNFSSWASEHKGLLWGVGLVVVAFGAYQVKDKTLVITKP